jgi:hypothetical protein
MEDLKGTLSSDKSFISFTSIVLGLQGKHEQLLVVVAKDDS